ncbi:MAG: peptidoglycan-binding domain-containing protein [Cyanobacteria bacterium J06555_13]
MVTKPLEIPLIITKENLAETQEAAAKQPIKFFLKWRGDADGPAQPKDPVVNTPVVDTPVAGAVNNDEFNNWSDTDDLREHIKHDPPKEPDQLFELTLRDEFGLPLANKHYSLAMGKRVYSGTSNEKGDISQRIVEQSGQTGKLTVFLDDEDLEDQLTWVVNLASMPPVSDIRGVQSRLNNLGFQAGELTDTLNDKTIEAIRAFQDSIDHPSPNGELDEQTRSELVKLHGS